MRKKTILGNFVKNEGVKYEASVKKLAGQGAYSSLVTFLPGSKKLAFTRENRQICLSGGGYKWLSYLSLSDYFCVTVLIGPGGDFLEWYFEISKKNFIDPDGTPCTDDLFLDFIVLPDGRNFTIDADELLDALNDETITPDDYEFAYQIRDEIADGEWNDPARLEQFFRGLLSDYE